MSPQPRASTAIGPGSDPAGALRAFSPPPEPPAARWGLVVVAILAATAVLAGVAGIMGAGSAATVIGAAGIVTAAVTAVVGWRMNRRRTVIWSLMTVTGQLLKAPVTARRVRWRGLGVGRIVKITLGYTDLAAAVYGGQLTRLVSGAVELATGRAFTIRRHRERHREIVLVERPPVAEQEQTSLERACARVGDVVAETFGADATVANVKTGEDLVTGFTVHYRAAAPRMTIAAVRRRTVVAVGERLAGQWKAQFALDADTVSFKRRPPLPTYLPRPAPPAPSPGDEAFDLIPQGVDEDGNIISWEIGGPFAHFLRAGRTRTGKALERSTIIPTPSGWTTMGALRVGDRVLDEAGRPTAVTGVYDQPPDRPCVEVAFSDGSVIVCDEEHLWWTETRAARISRQQESRDRDRRSPLSTATIEALRNRAAAAGPDDTLSLTEVQALLNGEVSETWLYEVARKVRPAAVEGQEHWFEYPEQTVRQRQKVLVYEAGASYRALATLVGTGRRYPRLAGHLVALERLASQTSDTATLTRRDLAASLHVPGWQAGGWLQSAGLPARREEREIELAVAAKRVRRAGRPGRRFAAADLLRALADAGSRTINDQRHRRAHGSVKTTREIAATLHTTTGHLNHSVPTAAALELPTIELPVPPYTLGAFLGDGGSQTGHIYSADPEVPARIRADGFEVQRMRLARDAWSKCRDYKIVGLRRQLKGIDLISKSRQPSRKRIPPEYLRASARQRGELLAGLLDTDGTVAPQGTVQYTTVLPGLADDVLELALSLGYRATSAEGRATLYGRDIGPKWTIAFTTDDPVFSLPRKLEALRQRTTNHRPDRVRNRMIVSVRPVPSVPLRCITVDSPSHLYLVGRTMIPTHNTVTVIGDALECARREMPVFVIDPKRVEFMGLRSWPNVQYVATTVQQQIALVHMLKKEMDERYRMVEEEGFPDSEFQPILLIIDEYRQLYGNVQAWWKSIKVPGMPAECPIFEWIGSLLRMAAYCRIHVDLATQRPDAAFLAGEIRDNFSARAATGRLSPDGAEMMFDTVHVGVNIPLNVRGRGTIVGVDDQPKEVQFFYTPDPRRPRNDEDRELLAKLRPATTRWPALAMHLPEPVTFADELPDGKKTNLEWEQLLRASFDPVDDNTAGEPADDADEVGGVVPQSSGVELSPADEGDAGFDIDQAYSKASPVPAGMVSKGDLLRLDASDGWVNVTDIARDAPSAGPGEVQLEWTDDDGQVGDLIIGRGELLEVRRPKA